MAVHEGYTCDLTETCPIVGPRFNKVGEDFDVCEAAFLKLTPAEQALYVRIDHPGAQPVPCVPGAGGTSAIMRSGADGLQPGTRFGLNLLALLAESGPNVFISPLSIVSALALAEAGATEASPTSDAFEAVLGRPSAAANEQRSLTAGLGEGCELFVANSVWSRGSLLKEYTERTSNLFEAAALALPSNAEPINSWVSEKTRGHITNLIDDAIVQDPLTVALLINAVFFKGAWAYQFDSDLTRPSKFNTCDRGPVDCNMMRKTGLTLPLATNGSATSVALPYKGGAVRAILILPESAQADAAHRLAVNLGAAGGWKDLRPSKDSPRKITISLPRFKLSYGVADIGPHLKGMGLKEAFDGRGQFLRMSNDPDVHISAVLHKAVLEVNEEGTVAAAATAVVMRSRCLPPPEQEMVFDRPFVFAIEHAASQELLFIGVVGSPELS